MASQIGPSQLSSIHKFAINHMVTGIPYIPMHEEVCKSYQFGKQIKLKFSIASQKLSVKAIVILARRSLQITSYSVFEWFQIFHGHHG